MADIIQIRRGLAVNWTNSNPILASGEIGFEIDLLGIKIGDALTQWNDLPYVPVKGDKGDIGAFYSVITLTAGENISGGKVISIHEDTLAYVYNINDENDYSRVYGIAKQAVLSGDDFEVYISGEVTEVGSGWQKGKRYYVGATGLLTETAPLTGIVKQCASGIGTDIVLLTSNTTDFVAT